MTNTIFGNYKCRRISKNGGFRDHIILHRRGEGITGAQALMQEFYCVKFFLDELFQVPDLRISNSRPITLAVPARFPPSNYQR